MRMDKTKLIGGVLTLAVVVVALGMLTGGVSSASPLGAASAGVHAAKTATQNTSQNYSFSANAPKWNSGNLCTPTTSGSTVTCAYVHTGGSGGGPAAAPTQSHCGCKTQTPLTYNFSGNHMNFVVSISNLQFQKVYLNFRGSHDTISVNVSGCSGGDLNITVMSQTTFTLNISASHVKAFVYLYSDADHYVTNTSGNCVTVWTYFVSARPKYNECPSSNDTKTDSYLLNITGWSDSQGLVFVNGVGYSTAFNSLSTGSWNQVSFENTTNFACSWSVAPPSTCHHGGWSPVADGVAVRKGE